jgi:hypothetical protein
MTAVMQKVSSNILIQLTLKYNYACFGDNFESKGFLDLKLNVLFSKATCNKNFD